MKNKINEDQYQRSLRWPCWFRRACSCLSPGLRQRPAPSVGGFQCTDGTIQGPWGVHLEGQDLFRHPWRRDPDLGLGWRGGRMTVWAISPRSTTSTVRSPAIVPDRLGSGTYQVNPDCTFSTQFVHWARRSHDRGARGNCCSRQ